MENSEELHVIPASYQIEDALELSGTKVLMKAGKKMPTVKQFLKENHRRGAEKIDGTFYWSGPWSPGSDYGSRKCRHTCKQSFRATVIDCPRYLSKRAKNKEDIR